MTTWILILTLYSTHSSSLTSVPGFTSREACLSAATTWQKDVRANSRYQSALAVCAKSGS